MLAEQMQTFLLQRCEYFRAKLATELSGFRENFLVWRSGSQ